MKKTQNSLIIDHYRTLAATLEEAGKAITKSLDNYPGPGKGLRGQQMIKTLGLHRQISEVVYPLGDALRGSLRSALGIMETIMDGDAKVVSN